MTDEGVLLPVEQKEDAAEAATEPAALIPEATAHGLRSRLGSSIERMRRKR